MCFLLQIVSKISSFHRISNISRLASLKLAAAKAKPITTITEWATAGGSQSLMENAPLLVV
jgi:hypothetical protein